MSLTSVAAASPGLREHHRRGDGEDARSGGTRRGAGHSCCSRDLTAVRVTPSSHEINQKQMPARNKGVPKAPSLNEELLDVDGC